MKTKKFGYLFAGLALVAALAGCGDKEATIAEDKLVIGVTAGLHEEITEVAAKIAEQDGLEVEIEVFSDYVLPNTALVEGDLDMNNFQHGPFLDTFNEERGEELVSVGKTILNPMGIYSNNYKSLDELPDGAKFALPNDPTNGGRSLAILAEAGYITLKEGVGITGTVYDVVDNPKNFEFIELEAAQIPTQLNEVDFAAINTNFALEAGLNPKDDSILLESIDSPYVNLLVVRPGDENNATVQKFIKAYQSDEVKQYIEETYEGAVIVGW